MLDDLVAGYPPVAEPKARGAFVSPPSRLGTVAILVGWAFPGHRLADESDVAGYISGRHNGLDPAPACREAQLVLIAAGLACEG